MKTAFIAFLLVALFLTSAIAVVEATTISIDGGVADWAGVAPIVVDPSGDGKDIDEDILRCYVANDGSNLYFRIDVDGSIRPQTGGGGGPPYYGVFLDVDQNPGTGEPVGDIGADYFVMAAYEVMEGGMEYISIIMDATMSYVAISSAAFSDGELEFTVPLSLIGYPSSIDMVFQASVIELATDNAPDTGHVTYGVEPPSIEADGDPSDWGTTPWILEDDVGEPEVADPMEDIAYCYLTNDDEVLYLRVDMVGAITNPTDVIFMAYFDTDNNPSTGFTEDFFSGRSIGIGADAGAMWGPMGAEPDGPFFGMLWDELVPPEGGRFVGAVSADVLGTTFEMAIPLAWLNNPSEINIVFFAILLDTDWTTPIRYVVIRPVGGEILPVNPLQVIAPYLLILVAAIAGAAGALHKKRIL